MSESESTIKNLSSLHPKKLEIIKFLISSCQGKSIEEMIPNLMATSSRLSDAGLSFTSKEISIIIDALKEHMSKEEQQRLDMIRPMIM